MKANEKGSGKRSAEPELGPDGTPQPDFFPPKVLDALGGFEGFESSWYANNLRAMGESPLYPPAADGPAVYRLLFLPTWQNAALIRLSAADEGWRMVCKHADWWGDMPPLPPHDKLLSEAERALSAMEAQEFCRRLDRAAFWKMPSARPSCGMDGDTTVFEGAHSGRYHVVDRWSPHGDAYSELIKFIRALCPDCDAGRERS